MATGKSIDWDTTTAIRGALTAEQESDVLCIQGGGLWTAHTLRAAGLLESGSCPWCGREEETLEHLWWRCEAFSDARSKVTRDLRVDPDQLPKCLALHGVAPEMAADISKAFWIVDPNETPPGPWGGATAWIEHVPRWVAEDAGWEWGVVGNGSMRLLLEKLAGPMPH